MHQDPNTPVAHRLLAVLVLRPLFPRNLLSHRRGAVEAAAAVSILWLDLGYNLVQPKIPMSTRMVGVRMLPQSLGRSSKRSNLPINLQKLTCMI